MKKVGITCITIVTLFFANAKGQGIYSTDGDTLFNFNTIHTVNINFSDPAFWDSLTAYHTTGECYMGSVAIDGKNLDSVCFALDGNASYTLMRGRVLNSITVANQQEVKIARKNLTNGIYILEINDQVGLQQKLKIVFN